MTGAVARSLTGLAAAMLIGGGLVHAAAFSSAAAIVDGAALPPFLVGAFKALWFIDSTLQVVLGLIAGVLALRPGLASGAVLWLLGLIPSGSAVLLYYFLPGFYAGHLMLACAAALIGAGLLWRRPAATA